jgi:hypothetical protein
MPHRVGIAATRRRLAPGEQAAQQDLAPPLLFALVTHGVRGWHTAPTTSPSGVLGPDESITRR